MDNEEKRNTESMPGITMNIPKSSVADVLHEDDNITPEMVQNFRTLVSQAYDLVDMMKDKWDETKDKYKLTTDVIDKAYAYARNHATPMPENLSDEEKEKWDSLNGLDNITEAEVIEIFGADHPIIDHDSYDVTKAQVKDCIEDFHNFIYALKEYKDITNALSELVDEQHTADMEVLRKRMESETDPVVKEDLKRALDEYDSLRTLGFLKEPLTDNEKKVLLNNYTDEKKITYYFNRAKGKLTSIGSAPTLLIGILNLEKRFLDSKYWVLDNIFWLYFTQSISTADLSDVKSDRTRRVQFMVAMMDQFIRRKLPDDVWNTIRDNIASFEQQLLDDPNFMNELNNKPESPIAQLNK